MTIAIEKGFMYNENINLNGGTRMGKLWILLGILYILSPVDAWPGLLDDLIVLGIMIACAVKLGIDPDDFDD